MSRLFVLLIPLLFPAVAYANLTGLWLTQDHDGVMAVSPCDGGLCVTIAGLIMDHPADPPPVDYRGVPQCHLPLVTDARQIKSNLWKGHITDPRNGSVYGVELQLDPHGNLALRGFVGIPLLGHTQTWTRFTGKVPNDCRLHARAPVAGQNVDGLADLTPTGTHYIKASGDKAAS